MKFLFNLDMGEFVIPVYRVSHILPARKCFISEDGRNKVIVLCDIHVLDHIKSFNIFDDDLDAVMFQFIFSFSFSFMARNIFLQRNERYSLSPRFFGA